ncbi:STAS domain-containing protein [bacterium]|nr:STAS domain-containing protein [bacterium]
MKISEKILEDKVVITLSGEIMGGDESEKFQSIVYKLIEDTKVNVVVDMSEVHWMNSSGLGMLMGALTTLRGSSGDLRLASISDRVRRPIEVTKLDSVIKIFASVDDALNSFNEEE